MAAEKNKGDDVINNINKTLVNSINKGVDILVQLKYVNEINTETIIQKHMPTIYGGWKAGVFDTEVYPWCNANREKLTVEAKNDGADPNSIAYGKAAAELQKSVPNAFSAAAQGKINIAQADIIPALGQMARCCIDDVAYAKWKAIKPKPPMPVNEADAIVKETPVTLRALGGVDTNTVFYKMFKEIKEYVEKGKKK
eukprot:51662_1